ncbi:TMEM175 family protein [Lentilactobacillus parakefiri]|uniref:Membrane protein n=1 Tax=Lentilactobacillus parakefiri TaxID=152332 RepID=A0A224VFZ8_9LACO|nr:TMEM175 family protein [Lentilactobacillus parakefiri]KRL74574.1 integral membrane protein [Lentilactobacillus parakefiri DSM 10551]PAK99886.1 hypothetical protein B8W96_09320 [Lentilactobacillus parakefiri]TDG92089.1 hypothetical protein C5L28_001480 [Lentilactobacillus parakefiri]GAW72013.1 membrane protein [Lentilactobacillus parakefiri]
MNKERLEAFTDAIIAIAATIMVLELQTPKEATIQGLGELWSVFLSYIVSFALIYIVCYSHHNIFEKADYISTKTFLLNGVWLFFLTLAPFTTAWIGKFPNDTLPEFIYALVLLLWSVTFQIMDIQIRHDNPTAQKDRTSLFQFRLVLYGGMVAGMIVSFFVLILTLVITGITTLTMILPMMKGSKI